MIKMRKISLLLLLLCCFVVSGCNISVNSSVYISSIGFEIENDELVGYFLSKPLTDIYRKSEEKNNTGILQRVKYLYFLF